MSEQQKGLDIENTGSERFVNEVFPDFVATTQAGAGAVTSGLLSYIDETMGASSKYKGVSSTYGGQY
jgi:hypothetical protein